MKQAETDWVKAAKLYFRPPTPPSQLIVQRCSPPWARTHDLSRIFATFNHLCPDIRQHVFAQGKPFTVWSYQNVVKVPVPCFDVVIFTQSISIEEFPVC